MFNTFNSELSPGPISESPLPGKKYKPQQTSGHQSTPAVKHKVMTKHNPATPTMPYTPDYGKTMISMTQPISTIVATILLLVGNDVMAQREYILNDTVYFSSSIDEPETQLLTGKKKSHRKETYQEKNCLQLKKPCAILYEHCNYEGNSRVIDENFWYVGAWRWSSIRINPGTVVTLFSDAGFGKNRPEHRYINASTACLSEQAFNDKTQSIIVETRQSLRKRMATGYQRCKKGLTTDCSAL